MAPTLPTFWQHLWLLLRMRAQSGLPRGGHRRAGAVVGFVAACAPVPALFAAGYALMATPEVAGSPPAQRFLLNLCSFVTSAVWCSWPLFSGAVDDHAQLSRFAHFPISPYRLLTASAAASLLEPRALTVHAFLAGATCWTALRLPGAAALWAVPLWLLYAAMNAFWARASACLALNALRSARGARWGLAVLVAVALAARLLPAVDTSWLTRQAGVGAALDERVLTRAATALGRVPPGYLGESLWRLRRGAPVTSAALAAGLGAAAWLGLFASVRLVRRSRLHERGTGGRAFTSGRTPAHPFHLGRTTWTALVARDVLEVVRHPKWPLLLGTPLVLVSMLRLLGGAELAEFALGERGRGWLAASVTLYAATLVLLTFAPNAFGFEPSAYRRFAAAPLPLHRVLACRNLAHGGLGVAAAALAGAFYQLQVGGLGPGTLAFCVGAAAAIAPAVLGAGNLLSIHFPLRFDPALRGRARLPVAASTLALIATGLACWPVLAAWSPQRPGVSLAQAGLWLGVFGACYALVFRKLPSQLMKQRETLLLSLSREP